MLHQELLILLLRRGSEPSTRLLHRQELFGVATYFCSKSTPRVLLFVAPFLTRPLVQAIAQQQTVRSDANEAQAALKQPVQARAAGMYSPPDWGGPPKG